MSNRVLRFINNTSHKEPLDTNQKGDILRTGEDEYSIRVDKDYHVLTDNVKTIVTDDYLKSEKTDNNVDLSIDEEKFIQLIEDNSPVTSVNGETGDVVIDIPEISSGGNDLSNVVSNINDDVTIRNQSTIEYYGKVVTIKCELRLNITEFESRSVDLFTVNDSYRPQSSLGGYSGMGVSDIIFMYNDNTNNFNIDAPCQVLLTSNGKVQLKLLSDETIHSSILNKGIYFTMTYVRK